MYKKANFKNSLQILRIWSSIYCKKKTAWCAIKNACCGKISTPCQILTPLFWSLEKKASGHSSTIDQNSIRILKSCTEYQSTSGFAGISVWFQSHLKKILKTAKILRKHLSPLLDHIDLQSINQLDSNLLYIFTSF